MIPKYLFDSENGFKTLKEKFEEECRKLEELRAKAKDFHPDDLYVSDESGNPVRIQKGK